jgi:hypothetical protein
LVKNITLEETMIHQAAHFASATLNNPFGIGTLSLALVVVPIIGMQLVYKYGWQHWAPFDNKYRK